MEGDKIKDTYKTIEAASQGEYKERGSRFIAYAFPIKNSDEMKPIMEEIKSEHYAARHHCFAYRIGQEGEDWRAFDDGEPSGTAGRPILGQLLSSDITNILVIVVRYFGGTKLGVPGLINAYRNATIEALNSAEIVIRTINAVFNFTFDYLAMNDVMRLIKDFDANIMEQHFDNTCHIKLSVRCGNAEAFYKRAELLENVTAEKGDIFM